MKNNKKGFTLIELLAVIVILAVVALIGMTAIGPVMANSRKAALRNNGLDLIASAKTAFQAEGLKSDPEFSNSENVCLSYAWLADKGYAEAKKDFDGSVLVKFDNGTSSYTYKYWIKNADFEMSAADESTSYEVATNKVTTVVNNCGGETADNTKYCLGTISYNISDKKFNIVASKCDTSNSSGGNSGNATNNTTNNTTN